MGRSQYSAKQTLVVECLSNDEKDFDTLLTLTKSKDFNPHSFANLVVVF